MSPQEIRKLRQVLQLTQQQLADKIGARQHTVARWETGMNEPKGAYAMLLRQLSEKMRRRRAMKMVGVQSKKRVSRR
jgi:DNA-binding transcriptional regulator YiaG